MRMLVACRLAGLSALGAYYAGVRVAAQTLGRVRLRGVRKNRYLARNSRYGDDDADRSLGNCYRRVSVEL